MKGELIRAIFISFVAATAALTVIGCAIRESGPQAPSEQAGPNSSPLPVKELCKSADAASADVAHKPGYRQFDVSVANSIGWPVSGLTQQDFVLYAGSQPLPVAYFREHKNDEPAAIALVVDASGSMASKLPIVRQSLGEFVKNLNRCDEVGLFAFNSQVYLLQPFSTDHEMTAERIEALYASGKSALYDATNAALQRLERSDYPNRKLILIADGIDNSSTVTEQAVIARATKDGIPIYAVGIGDPNAKTGIAVGPLNITGQSYWPSDAPVEAGPPDSGIPTNFVVGFRSPVVTDRVDAKNIENLSAMAGGRSFIVPSRGEVDGKSFENAISAISDNIAQGYTIGAVVPADVSPSTVKVTVAKRLNLNVQAHPLAAPP
jgi:VWFA-related protein